MPIRKLASGRYQVDYADGRAGIARTRRNFRTRAEAREYEKALRQDAGRLLLDRSRGRTLAEALTRYLVEESPKKQSHHDDISNARALRWPVWDSEARAWRRLEQAPLNPGRGEADVARRLALWVHDMQQIERRAYIGGELYQRRADGWWHQPDPGDWPQPRARVTDHGLLGALEAAPGRGPFSPTTLRTRQMLVSRVLAVAWRVWGWCDSDQGGRIDFVAPAPGRRTCFSGDDVRRLAMHAPPHFDDLILGAAWLGLRRENLLALTWSRVRFTVRDQSDDIMQRGDIFLPAGGNNSPRGERTKNRRDHWLPLSTRAEQLLLTRWWLRDGSLVFHRGDGTKWGDFRRLWADTKRAAGITGDHRWHDLRGAWATSYAALSAAQLAALGGWQSTQTAERYIRMQRADLDALVDDHL